MDTSSLASGLSLSGFLLAFGYLSLAEHTTISLSGPIRLPENLGRLVFSLRLLRLASVIAIALSVQALLVSRTSPSVWLNAIVALDLLVLLVISDRATRQLAMRYHAAVSRVAAPLTAPLLGILNRLQQTALEEQNGANGGDAGGLQDQTEETTVVITEEGEATLDARERLMIRSILRLDESTAREVMVPRVDIVALEAEVPIPEVATRMLKCGHSRLPVYSNSLDELLGVVYSRDLLPFLAKTEAYPPLRDIIRPAFFIPESKRLDELLTELQEKQVQMAIIVDEYGGVEGLVTLEDLLEEIVGEIEDEFSRGLEPRVVPMSNGDIIVDARVTLDYLSDLYSTPFESEDVDTVGGLVYSELGKMPQVGDEVEHNGLNIEVVSLLGRRIRRLKLSKRTSRQSR